MKQTLRFIILACIVACAASGSANAQKWSVSTNLLDYVNLGTINAEVGVSVSKHWTVSLAGKYNPFYFNFPENPILNKKGQVAFNARYWPFFVYSGMFYGFGAQGGVFRCGGIFSRFTREGVVAGLTFELGYSLVVSKHFNVEFGAAVWGGVSDYTMYEDTRCGRKRGHYTKPFLAICDLQINLVYVF